MSLRKAGQCTTKTGLIENFKPNTNLAIHNWFLGAPQHFMPTKTGAFYCESLNL